ncbi:hypothetical protein FKW77_002731 [Venturia effusa]|uniref:Uncharacterized protein n=1 Tax=Venturia effusa TaxID=50376 RepID=A0A517L6X1_9PEZI|nr:hypothetical protein FKW77_002731 [Venturia effusa]
MKFSIVIAYLPASTYAWHIASLCCDSTVVSFKKEGYGGCAKVEINRKQVEVPVTPEFATLATISGVYAPTSTLVSGILNVKTKPIAIRTGFDFKDGQSAPNV